MNKGYVAIGIYGSKTPINLGTLWRTANLYDASLIFTVGKRYKNQPSDTMKTNKHIPLLHFNTIEELLSSKDSQIPLIAVELINGAISLKEFAHPKSAWYLLGAEDDGLPSEVLNSVNQVVQIPCSRTESMNVAVAGSIILFDRHCKRSI